ncbi:DinB family protein [Salimicrobium salexigens]|uniref:DinB superfamily protein n=1 Tax=Salimicrobium salexigens TaxID=908941 RepID=A0ABY1KUC6_9BACI|nr:DinB family protein [Salimicrobium salexigens]SIS77247.1 DinB superfamily protein [Salimicrobium salexigens]
MYGLEDKRKLIQDFISQVSEEDAGKKPSDNTWSILEILEHLYLMENFIIEQINDVIKNGTKESASPKPIERTTNRSHKVEAPEAVRPSGAFSSIQEAREALEKTREATMFLTHNKSGNTLQQYSFPHPSFGAMNLEQWVEFIGWHEMRHLEQMKEVQEQIS